MMLQLPVNDSRLVNKVLHLNAILKIIIFYLFNWNIIYVQWLIIEGGALLVGIE